MGGDPNTEDGLTSRRVLERGIADMDLGEIHRVGVCEKERVTYVKVGLVMTCIATQIVRGFAADMWS